MLGSLWYLVAVAYLPNASAYPRNKISDIQSAVTLPSWKQNGGEIHLFQEISQSGDTRLTSGFLNVSGDTCVEFWFHKPGPNSTDVKMLIIDTIGERELWNSRGSVGSAWQQVLVPLIYNEDAIIQVVFEAMQEVPADEYTAIDNVQVRRGLCGEPCTRGSEFWADGSCSTRCTCSRRGLRCYPASCPEDHTCEVNNGTLGCWPSSTSGTCSVYSEARYATFDGAGFRFEGPCTYILAKVCSDSPDLPYFSVEAENKQGVNESSSIIQQVNIDLYGLRISMLRKEQNKVIVNGLWKRLPLSLKGNLVRINPSGCSVTMTTDLHLMVTFDSDDTVRVKVPAQYSSKTCGLCGNFNRLREDDYMQPNGLQALDAGTLGRSWQKDGTLCETAFLPQLCLGQEEAEFESEHSCGLLLSADGPLAACSTLVSPEPYFRACVLDMCSTHGLPQTLCEALQHYADNCKEVGVHLPGWRNSTLCPMTCQKNSQYNACASGCPPACSAMDAPSNCSDCEERCECDPGFMLSGGACVSPQDCGCWHDSQHYEKGATFMTANCEMLCQCMEGGEIQCTPASCSKDQVCKSKNGILGCFSLAMVTCQVFGDPHYITFDGKIFDFQGACNYTLSTTCEISAVPFTVTVRNENRGNPAWSALNSVALAVEGIHIVLKKHRKVYVNGQLAELPLEPSSRISVFLKGPYVQVETTVGVRLLFDGQHRLFLQVDERYKGKVCGLCGTYSGSQFDDFATPGGELVSDKDDFADSWRVADSEWECVPRPPPLPECDKDLSNAGYQECSILSEDLFQPCHWFVPPKLFITRCVYDHCATLGDPYQLCISLESYAATCEMAGVDLGNWRGGTPCANFTSQPTNGPATASPFPVCSLNCDFDNDDYCGWTQLITDSFDWSRHRGPTATDFTGPLHDHTTGDGYYMYIEADGPQYGDSARMLSPPCLAAGPVCLHFWYHMYGSASTMALNMYQLQNNTATKIWSAVNNKGNQWLPAEVDLNIFGTFQIIVEGIRGSNYWSDVALDDVAIQQGICSGMSDTELGAATAPACKLHCTFDVDICEWNQLFTDSFDWTRLKGSTPTPMTGPSSDHTSGDGHYLYIEADGIHNGDTARLISPDCPVSGLYCLQFWYHMYGTAETMGLAVYKLENQTGQRLWTLYNNQGDTWHAAQVELVASGTFKIIFEGQRGTDERSDVAVDDVSLHQGSCSSIKNAH